eukprot:UN19469
MRLSKSFLNFFNFVESPIYFLESLDKKGEVPNRYPPTKKTTLACALHNRIFYWL